LESGFGGEELLQTEAVGCQVVLQLGNAVLHIGAAVVVAPDFFLSGLAQNRK